MTESIGAFQVLESTSIAGGGLDVRAARAGSGEEVRLWLGAAGRTQGDDGLSPEEWVRRLAKIYQANLPRVLEGFVPDDRAVLVVQAYKGRALEERLAAGPVPTVDALDVAKSIGAALAKAHAQDVRHGCVAEPSIFLHEDGRALLLYLGLGPFLGPRPPRAPEDLDGGTHETSDVYGLSRVLVRLVTGTDPLFRVDALDARAELAHGTSHAPEDFPADLPEGLRRLLARAIHRDPLERIRRAEELAGDLRVLRASWDSIAIRPRARLPFPRIGRIVVLGALAALVVLGVSLARGCSARAGFPG